MPKFPECSIVRKTLDSFAHVLIPVISALFQFGFDPCGRDRSVNMIMSASLHVMSFLDANTT